MSLLELQEELRQACTIEVSLQTITRTLQREGYTLKTVRPLFFCLIDDTINLFCRSHVLLWSEMSATVKNS
jgi:hypothetical protein